MLLLALAFLVRDPEVGAAPLMREALRLADAWRLSWLGLASVLVIYPLASALLIPVNLLIAVTAAAFGPFLGFGYALAGALLAASLTFALGRAIGRHPVRRLAGRRVNAVRRRLSEHGLWAMTLLRLLPVAPFTLVNLVAGTARIRFRDFLLGSLLGMLPGTALLAAFGDRLGAWLRRPDSRQPRGRGRRRARGDRARRGARLVGAAAAGRVSARLRIASYNIHACRGARPAPGRGPHRRGAARDRRRRDRPAGGRIAPRPQPDRPGRGARPGARHATASRGRCCAASAAGTAMRC